MTTRICMSMVAGMTTLSLFTGCAFNRTIVNEHVRAMDTAFIKPGQTTGLDVLTRLGPPHCQTNGEDAQSLFGDDFIRYVCYETRSTQFNFGYVLIFPYKWSDTQAIEECLITLDSRGVVTDVIRTNRDTIRTPLQSENSRLPLNCSSLTATGGPQ